MRILLLGKTGMLGRAFMQAFNERGDLCLYGDRGLYLKQSFGSMSFSDVEVFGFGREDLDVCDYVEMERVFLEVTPDILINCTAYTNVDAAEDDEITAIQVNTDATGHMARFCQQFGVTMVHFSTDYVFDGESQQEWNEDDTASPINIYGSSKLGGEIEIKKSGAEYYILRTAWLYGEHGDNFADTMLRLADEKEESGEELTVVGDQFGSPTYTKDLVEIVIRDFLNLEGKGEKLKSGIYHVTNSGSCSWFDFAKEIFRLKGKFVSVKKVSSEEFKKPAKRPHYSVLKNNKIQTLRKWNEALEEYLKKKK